MTSGTPDKKADWAILVYISADGVLANFAVESLKQLKRAAGDGVVVAAQVDKNGKRQARRYRFDGRGQIDSSIESNQKIVKNRALRRGIAYPTNLTAFVDWASIKSGQPNADHYCLFTWGHGAELLLDEDRPRADKGTTLRDYKSRRYLTPANLRKALQDTKLKTEHRKSLDIIGIDACAMSMVEVAIELQGYADFMVASQEDVPDTSFPYENILAGLKEKDGVKKEAKDACKMIAELYKHAFSDYIASPSSGLRAITLSSLDLKKVDTIARPLTSLADALLASKSSQDMREAILAARSESRGFAFGLFVDLSDFCGRLRKKLRRKNGNNADLLKSACADICKTLKERDGGFVVKNETDEKGKGCHGLSIYFPYRKDDETEAFQVLRAKGGENRPLKGGENRPLKGGENRPLKGGENRPLKGGENRPLKERSARIEELEEDLKDLTRFNRTRWSKFIKEGWSFILATETSSGELDQHYSAQQCAKNLAA